MYLAILSSTKSVFNARLLRHMDLIQKGFISQKSEIIPFGAINDHGLEKFVVPTFCSSHFFLLIPSVPDEDSHLNITLTMAPENYFFSFFMTTPL